MCVGHKAQGRQAVRAVLKDSGRQEACCLKEDEARAYLEMVIEEW